jgi:hypothetical protein
MWSVVERNVVIRRIAVIIVGERKHLKEKMEQIAMYRMWQGRKR